MTYCLLITEIETENIAGGPAGDDFFFRYPRGGTASGVFPASSIASISLAFGVDFDFRTLRTGAPKKSRPL